MKLLEYRGYDVLLGGLLMALALVFPVIFHMVGLGSSFLPMFFPVMAAGFILALPAAVVVGFMSPLVSALLTGMPPFFPPIAFIMMVEGVVLAALPVFLYQRYKMNIWATAVIAMLVDRLVLLISVLLLSRLLQLPEGVLTVTALIRGIPGTILIPLVIPAVIKQVEPKMKLIRIME
jgi:hypothetical protein